MFENKNTSDRIVLFHSHSDPERPLLLFDRVESAEQQSLTGNWFHRFKMAVNSAGNDCPS